MFAGPGAVSTATEQRACAPCSKTRARALGRAREVEGDKAQEKDEVAIVPLAEALRAADDGVARTSFSTTEVGARSPGGSLSQQASSQQSERSGLARSGALDHALRSSHDSAGCGLRRWHSPGPG